LVVFVFVFALVVLGVELARQVLYHFSHSAGLSFYDTNELIGELMTVISSEKPPDEKPSIPSVVLPEGLS
jgi:hypothetical protein